MGKLRFLLALWAAKLSRPVLKLTKHNGTNFPGELAIKLCPDFLRQVGKPKHIIAVTGTNGKTTVCNLLLDVLKADGITAMNNREGSNINTGIATSLALGANLFGRSKFSHAVFEVDERWSLKVYPDLKPDYILITNLSRDSVPRNAHPAFIADIISRAVPAGTKLILNADDLISSGVAPENPRVHFGIRPMDTDVIDCVNRINDMRICPRCQGKLVYDYRRYHHIGRAHCERCDFASPEYDYAADCVDREKMTFTMSDKGGEHTYRLFSDSIFNIYNEAALVALLRELGWEHEKIAKCMDGVSIVATRYNVKEAGDVRVIMQMAKDMNAYACSRAFDYVSGLPGEKEIVLMLRNSNDIHNQTENICWAFDCDFEFLNRENIHRIVVAGRRSRDLYLRLLLAGVPEEKLVRVDEERDIPEAVLLKPGTDIYMFYGTDALNLVQEVRDAIVLRAEGRQEA